jgi:hypothetical protein
MLATLLIWLTAAVAVLALVDLLLSKAQKKWLSDASIKAWSILDEAKGWSLADWLKKPRARWWLALSLGLLWFAFQASITVYDMPLDLSDPIAEINFHMTVTHLMLVTTIICLVVASPFFANLLDVGSPKLLVRKLAIISMFALLGYGFSISLIWWIEPFKGWWIWDVVASALYVGGLVPAFTILLGILTILAAMGLAYLASAILYVCEFIIRRIAEYPKGPVLAISALFGGIVALIKAFG